MSRAYIVIACCAGQFTSVQAVLRLAAALVVTFFVVPMCCAADPVLPGHYLRTPLSDVDKGHTTETDGTWRLNADEKWRCWQATFANILFGLGAVPHADDTYRTFLSLWPDVPTTAGEQEMLYDAYLRNHSLPYDATVYTGFDVTPAFARQELFRGQGVKLGIGNASGASHAVTFQGWNRDESMISDSDGDYGGADVTAWFDSGGSGQPWHITYGSEDLIVWNIITVCPIPPIPEPIAHTVMLLVAFVSATLVARKHSRGKKMRSLAI